MTEKYEQLWDLSDLYAGPDDPALNRDHDDLETDLQRFRERYAGSCDILRNAPEQMAEALEHYARIYGKLHNLMVYALLEWNVATQDPEVNSFRDRLNRKVAESSTKMEFFRQFLTHLKPDEVTALIAHEKVKPYATFLDKTARFQPHLLNESEEKMLQLSQQFSRQRWFDFYAQTTSLWSFDIQGQEMTEDEAMDLLRRTDPAQRLEGYEAVYSKYADAQDFIAYIYNTLLQEYAQESRLRQFDSTLSKQAFEQELKAEQVEHLLQEVDARVDLFQRYYRHLAQQCGMEKLRSCDLNAPLSTQDWRVDWQRAQDIVLQAVEPLGEEISAKTRAFFERRWIHAQPMKGKASGAFCAPTARQHPFILMNWNDNLYSLTALAHELGHGIHFYETVEHQNVLHLMPPLFLAETASTLNEYLLADSLMARSDSAELKRFFLSDLLQRFLNGIFRQSQISAFEVFAHREGTQRQLSAEELNAKWMELARQRGGESLETLDAEASGWSRIPHIFMHPFYCYNYTLSNLIVLALIHQYQQQRAQFLPRYQRFLQSGGGASAQALLSLLNLDLEQPDFYSNAFSVLENLIDQLERLSPSTERGNS